MDVLLDVRVFAIYQKTKVDSHSWVTNPWKSSPTCVSWKKEYHTGFERHEGQ